MNEKRKTEYVDPIIGTVGDEKADSFHGGGKTHPGACTPGGLVQLSPDTVTGGDNGTGYNYCQNTIEGFSFNHMSGIGWYGDLGNLQVMPVVGKTDLRSGSNEEIPFEKGTLGWKSGFTHEKEWARAGYYGVELERYGIFAEATVSPHIGYLRFTYPKEADSRLIFNFSRRIAGHADFQHVEVVNDTCLEGYIQCTKAGGGFGRGHGGIGYTLYFVCQLSVPMKEYDFFENESFSENKDVSGPLQVYEGKDVGLLAKFVLPEDKLVLKCGISYTDLKGARKNLLEEGIGFEFDQMAEKAADLWEEAFDGMEVEGTDEVDKTLFYTCLYHALLDPRITADVDGRFRSADGKIHKVDYTQRTMFSGWDVYRSEFPLLTLIRPEMVNDTINSLLQIAEENHSGLPRWELMGIDSGCMVGDPGLIVTADAFLKGIRGFDTKKAYQIGIASVKGEALDGAVLKTHRLDCKAYRKDAFVPGKLSDTLEYLLADYGLMRFAKEMGYEEDAAWLKERIARYGENYNEATGFMGARDENGAFLPVRDEYDETGCVESNIFQQSWFVPYDVEGMAKLFGEERTMELLERLFAGADLTALWNQDYNHSNEPCHNLTHYFSMLGQPCRTQYWTRRVQKEAYRLGAFGFCGNEDVGQLSAWYVLSALGFAQVCPGDEKFWVNTPLFQKAVVPLDPKYHTCSVDHTLQIVCDKDPLEYPYIDAIYLNREQVNRYYLTYGELTAGGTLEFRLKKEN